MICSDFYLLLKPSLPGSALDTALTQDNYDIKGRVTTDAFGCMPFEFGRVGGVCRSCQAQDDGLLVAVDGGKLLPGKIFAELTVRIPNNDYPDGFQDVISTIDTGQTLTPDTGTGMVRAYVLCSPPTAQPQPAALKGSGIHQIYAYVEGGKLKVTGHAELLKAGYVPYIFRRTHKRNKFTNRRTHEIIEKKKYSLPRKGWNLFGHQHLVRIVDGTVQFMNVVKHAEEDGYTMQFSEEAEEFVTVHEDEDGFHSVAWGRSKISLHKREYIPEEECWGDVDTKRRVRLRFAIAFGLPYRQNNTRITPANMVTNLAEFSVVFTPNGINGQEYWTFSR